MLRKLVFLAICVLATVSFGCAGTMYQQQSQLANGGTLTHYGRTGVFGTDGYGGVYSPPPQGPPVVKLEKTYSRDYKSWDSKCGNPKQNKNFHFEQEHRAEAEDVLNPAANPSPVAIGGTNPSTGNIFLPAAAQAAGIAVSGALAPGTNISVGAKATGGSGGNSKSSSAGGQGGAGGNSNAEMNNSGNSRSNSEINNSGNSKIVDSGNSKSVSQGGSATGGTAYGGDATAYGGSATSISKSSADANSSSYSNSNAELNSKIGIDVSQSQKMTGGGGDKIHFNNNGNDHSH